MTLEEEIAKELADIVKAQITALKVQLDAQAARRAQELTELRDRLMDDNRKLH